MIINICVFAVSVSIFIYFFPTGGCGHQDHLFVLSHAH